MPPAGQHHGDVEQHHALNHAFIMNMKSTLLMMPFASMTILMPKRYRSTNPPFSSADPCAAMYCTSPPSVAHTSCGENPGCTPPFRRAVFLILEPRRLVVVVILQFRHYLHSLHPEHGLLLAPPARPSRKGPATPRFVQRHANVSPGSTRRFSRRPLHAHERPRRSPAP